jgi:hypothetical protein
MLLRSWTRRLSALLPVKPNRARRQPLRLECLEDRLAPAVLTVNSTDDSGNATSPYLSLGEAIAIVNSPTLPTGLSTQIQGQITGTLHQDQTDTIRFDHSQVTAPIVLGGTGLALSLPAGTAVITIDGGSAEVTVDGNKASDIFQVDSGVQANLTNLTITHGNASGGGGIFNGGTLTVTNSTIAANSATRSADAGGGIYNRGTLTLTNSTISGNSATIAGGGIANGGTATLNNSIVADNGGGGDLFGNFTGSHDLIGDGSGLGLTSPLKGNPLLGTLGYYGGPTQTMPLLPGSPARGAGAALTTVSGTLNSTTASLTVADAAVLGLIPNRTVLLIDSEQVLVTAVNGNTLTVTRGVNGTTAAGHSSGAGVNLATDQRGFPLASGNPDIGAFQTQSNPFLVTTATDPGGLVGLLSLREAINLANAYQGDAGTAAITFDIPTSDPNYNATTGSYLIHLLSALPTATVPVVIDGTSEPGYAGKPLIELNGSGAGSSGNGLSLSGGSSTVQGLTIDHFGGSGIVLGSDNNLVVSDYIGTNNAGSAASANATGILVNGKANTIGGTTAATRNVISGNGTGVSLSGANNLVLGNYLGTNVSGSAAIANTTYAILISTAGNAIGGSAAGAGNIISGNATGIYLNGAAVTGNNIEGNNIGTTPSGNGALGNTSFGIYISGAGSNTIGGTTAATRNVISGNTTGLYLASGASGTLVEGNDIGTDVTGSVKIANTSYGIYLNKSAGNTIGGTASGASNVISGNSAAGVYIAGTGATGNKIEGNYIGTNSGGAALGNGTGVLLSGVSGNTIGGTAAGAGNTIADNGTYGVEVSGGSGDAILADSIFSNGSLGIALLGSGNNSEPAPVLTAAGYSNGTLTVSGTVQGTVGATLTIEFFSNPTSSAQGETYLGSTTVTVPSGGTATFSGVTLTTTLTAKGDYLTATATDANGNTSQFSGALVVS